MAKNSELKAGDQVLVKYYRASFDVLDESEKDWSNFNGALLKIYTTGALVDVSKSKELTKSQIRATQTGRIVVRIDDCVGVSRGARMYTEAYLRQRKTRESQSAIAAREKKYEQMAKVMKEYIDRGYTMNEAAQAVGTSGARATMIQKVYQLKTRQRYHMQWLKPDGTIGYFKQVKDVKTYGMVKSTFSYHETNHWGTFHSGKWFEATDGEIRPVPTEKLVSKWPR